jgi:hypothetical protein
VHASVVSIIDNDHCCFGAMLCAWIIVVSVLRVSVVIIEHEIAIVVRVRVAIVVRLLWEWELPFVGCAVIFAVQ